MDSNCIQYKAGEGGGGSLPYRVLLQDGEQTDGTSVNASSLGNHFEFDLSQAVPASPFYENPSEWGMGPRTIAPRAGPSAVEPNSVQNPKASHNEVERRRRDNVNHWIMKLGNLIPDCNNWNRKFAGGKHAQSKSGILAQACENLAETRNTNQRLVESLQQSEGVYAENERLSSQIEQLQQENALLNQQLQNHGIVPQIQDIQFSM